VTHHSGPHANSSAPITPGTRNPTRAPRRAEGTVKRVAIAGPGNSINPAVSTSSCQTVVRKSTPASSMAPKPPKNSSDPVTASPKLRTRSIAGSSTGAS
jgi:hypothetical protein